MQQASGESQTLLHAFREVAHADVHRICQVHTLHRGFHWLGLSVMESPKQLEILPSGQLQVMVRELEGDTDLPIVVTVPIA